MQPINLSQKFSQFNDHWNPKIVGELNGQHVKLAKVKGEFVWHDHRDEDELFRMLIKKITALSFLLSTVATVSFAQSSGNIEQKLTEMDVTLYELPAPTANYVRAVRSGKLVFLAGHGPMQPNGTNVTGKLGQDLSVEEGQQAARYTAIALLSALKEEIGDLDQVQRIVKVHGMVNCTADFTDHSQVINGFSDFMAEVFGEAGKHARAAVGMNSLPGNIAVEIEMVVEVK